MTDHRITVSDGEPFLVGARIEYDPAEHGVILPPVPPDIQERWSTAPAPEWEIAIGSDESKP